jgi:putative SOS response-associated peptidase YedK
MAELNDELDLPPRYNIAPTETTPIVTNRASKKQETPAPMRRLELFRWGLVPSWSTDASGAARMINARSESLIEKPSFRKSLLTRRCIVPANGFYEWKMAEKKTKGVKQPAYVQRVGDGVIGMAGLWDVWRQPDQSWLKTFTIITVPANDVLTEYHIRMPAILRREDEEAWLDHSSEDVGALSALLRTTPPSNLTLHPVSPAVNTAGVDDPSLILPFAAPALTLDL